MKQEVQTSYGRLADMPAENMAQLEVVGGWPMAQKIDDAPAPKKMRLLTPQFVVDWVDANSNDVFINKGLTGDYDEDEEVYLTLKELQAFANAAHAYMLNKE
jgi:hypothetical protein